MMQSAAPQKDFGQRLTDAIQANPIAAALVGMGVLWLFTGGNRTTISDLAAPTATGATTASNLAPKLATAGKSVGETLVSAGSAAVSSAADAATEAMSGMGGVVGGAVDAAQRSGGELAGVAQQSVAHLFERQPLAVGAFGLIIGAAIGSAFQTTHVEQETFGEASQALKEQAEELISSATGSDHANTTSGTVGGGAQSLVDKVANVANAALDAAQKRTRG